MFAVNVLSGRNLGWLAAGMIHIAGYVVIANGIMFPQKTAAGLNPKDKKRVGKYSLGMRQRLGLAQAIMEDPDILLLDEPMNGLDNQGVKDMKKLLMELRGQGKTIILASHHMEDITELCDIVYRMDAGKLTLETEPA